MVGSGSSYSSLAKQTLSPPLLTAAISKTKFRT
jgi:hypothetical protein